MSPSNSWTLLMEALILKSVQLLPLLPMETWIQQVAVLDSYIPWKRINDCNTNECNVFVNNPESSLQLLVEKTSWLHADWRNQSPSMSSDQYDHRVSWFFLPFSHILNIKLHFSFWLGDHPIYIDRTCLILFALSQPNPDFEIVADVFGKRRYPLLCAGETTSRIKARCHGKQRYMKGWQWKHAAS